MSKVKVAKTIAEKSKSAITINNDSTMTTTTTSTTAIATISTVCSAASSRSIDINDRIAVYPLGAVCCGFCTKTRAVPACEDCVPHAEPRATDTKTRAVPRCMDCVLHAEPRAPAADTRRSSERFGGGRRGQEARTIVTSELSLIDCLRRGSANLCRDVDCGTVEGSGIADGVGCGTIGGSDLADGTHLDVVRFGNHLDVVGFGTHLDVEGGVGAGLTHAYPRGPCV